MPKYYCDYCKSYLTHDTMSVRKSHLMGKNHIKLYCEYYEAEARKQNQWEQNKIPYEVKLSDLYEGIPGKPATASSSEDATEVDIQGYVPPPPTLTGFPNPPPSVYHFDSNLEKKKITEVMRKQIKEQQLNL